VNDARPGDIMTDFEELIAERDGLRTKLVELRREVGLLQRDNIDLIEENEQLRRLVPAVFLPVRRPCGDDAPKTAPGTS
jgi:hypothetical protein